MSSLVQRLTEAAAIKAYTESIENRSPDLSGVQHVMARQSAEMRRP